MTRIKILPYLCICLCFGFSNQGHAQNWQSVFSPIKNSTCSFFVDYFAYKHLVTFAANVYGLGDSTVKPRPYYWISAEYIPESEMWTRVFGSYNFSKKLGDEYKRRLFWQMYYRQNTGTHIQEEKAKLITLLTEMTDAKELFPDISRYIEKKHKGNINVCVDYWLAHSIFTDSITRRDFLKKPTAKRLKRDPAYLLTQSLVKNKALKLLASAPPNFVGRVHLRNSFTDEDLWQLNLEKVASLYQRLKLLEECQLMQKFGGVTGYRKSQKWAKAYNVKLDTLDHFDIQNPQYYASIVKTPTSWEASKRFMYQEVRNWVVGNEPLAIREFIHNRFHDDTDAFVDYMYKHSIFAGYRNFELFSDITSAEQIREDPFVLYSISRQQYLKSKQ